MKRTVSSAPSRARRFPLVAALLFAASCFLPAAAVAHASPDGAAKKSQPDRSARKAPQSSHFVATKGKSRSSKMKRYRARRRGQKAPTADRIDEIQAALGRNGLYSGEPSGKMDAKTQEALRQFQQANGLSPTGKIDALTLQKLGLGSSTAGLAAPRPAPASDNQQNR
jgi:Putative peptidoglycan binding domain